MKSTKSITRLLAALLLIATMLLSMSSCVVDFESFREMFEGYMDYSDDSDNGGDSEHNKNPGESINPDTGNTSNTSPSDNYGKFYPTVNDDRLEKVPALQQTLLSTVVIISQFGSSAGAGSGVIYQVDKEKGDAYIITNQHVVYNETGVATNIKVYLYGMELEGYAITARFLGGTVNYDIAVLKIEGSEVIKNSYAKAVDIGKSAEIKLFDSVFAVGNPEGRGFSVTEGIVSVTDEEIQLEGADGSYIQTRVMRIDAAVNHGNSGGGLYDEGGKLIGIVSAKAAGQDIDNMGYAIPVDLVKNLANNIIYHCDGVNMTKLNRALLGITITAYSKGLEIDEQGNIYQRELVEVMAVSTASLAYGKVQIGDIVNSITVDGVKVEATQVHLVPEHMLNARLGSVVVMNVTRGNTTFDISFTVTKDAMTLEN